PRRRTEGRGPPRRVARRPRRARHRRQCKPDRKAAARRCPDRADLTAHRARSVGRACAAAGRDPRAARARLRQLDRYGNFSAELRLPAASCATIRTVRTRPCGNAKTPPRTCCTVRRPFTTSRTLTGSLTQNCNRRKAIARSRGGVLSTRKRALGVIAPISFVAVSTPAYVPSFTPTLFHAMDCGPG